MKILLLNQFFWPESAATSQLLTDLAIHFVEQGHEVSVICTETGGYSISSDEQPPSVRIYRTKNLPFYRGNLGRVLSYASFYISAALHGLALPRQDLVLTLTTPPLLSLLGTAIKTLRGSTHFIWEMDVYPDVAVDLDHFKAGGILDRVIGMLADFSRHRADGIIALGNCMKSRLIQRGVHRERIHVAENWADGRAIKPMDRSSEDARLTVLYSGNLGLAHDVDTISGAILNLSDDTRFRFVFVGDGGNTRQLVEFCSENNLRQVSFLPYVQRSHLGNSLSIGDIGLVTQRESCCGSVVPSKVYGLLAAGRPILFIGPAAATPARIIQKFGCGWAIRCGDTDALTDLLMRLADDPAEVSVAGQLAREAFLNHYDRPLGVARIAHILGTDSLSSNRKPFPGPLQQKRTF
ncbi:glycosyltransferase family 4 protein [Edaphobacter sp. HDX4]|uniref:glycosyltransferase family 4 protein n=1 Tax=Edaphobacter sp. HDX4 TaxID=2794064 RepID=UPI002FE654BB